MSVHNTYKPIDKEGCKAYYKVMRGSFAGLVVVTILFFVLVIVHPNIWGGVLLALFLIALVCAIAYYIALAVLASKNHRNVFGWIFATLVTSPIGFIAGFLMMRNVGIRNGWV